jgi:hypothetical protein
LLELQVRIEGDKIVINNLTSMPAKIQTAIGRGLKRSGRGITREAYAFLSGAGGMGKKKVTGTGGFTKKSGEQVKWNTYEGAGKYPVPVRTGHLRQLLDFLDPGKSKSGPAGTFTAGPFEEVIFDSAEYADVIHEGRGSSEKFGRRRAYMTDALDKFNSGDGIMKIFHEEIEQELEK